MGLGTTNKSNGTYLTLAGGFIWNRKADESDPNYATQTYETPEGKKERSGAQYADLIGRVTNVEFRTHEKYGENINVKFESDGEAYIVSVGTNNRYAQDLMKGLLKVDLTKDVYIKPFDFMGDQNTLVDGKWVPTGAKKRIIGISFKQDGEKINIRNDEAPQYDGDWSNKKRVKRYFEDLADWYVDEIKAKVITQLEGSEMPEESYDSGSEEETPKVEKKTEKKIEKEPSVLQMKKAIKAYIEENYEDESMPKLTKDEVKKWYKIVLAEEELPFEEGEVSAEDLNSQLSALMG